MRKRILRGVFALLLAVTLVAGVFVVTPSVGQADPGPGVTMQLAVCLDGSGSISVGNFDIMKEGLAEAVEDPTVLPQDGSAELTVVQFGAGSGAVLEVDPVVINSQAVASSTANHIRNITKGNGGTPMDKAIKMATTAITGSPNFRTDNWQVINISTDGIPSSKPNTILARDDAIAAGIDEIDAEAIGVSSANFDWIRDYLVWPSPGVAAPPYPPRPPDPLFRGFVCEVANFSEYAVAIKEKLYRVVIPEQEHYIYSVKFLCGKVKSVEVGVELASYATAINIHNLLDEEVMLLKKAVIANREDEPFGIISEYRKLILKPGTAVEVDCVDICSLLGVKFPPSQFIKGFVVIESDTPLNVVAVYTTRSWWGKVSIDIEQISPVALP